MMFRLHWIKYGRSYDVDDEDAEPIARLEGLVKFFQVIGNLIIITYETLEGFNKIGLFNRDEHHVIDDQYKIDRHLGYSVFQDSNKIACLHNLKPIGPDITLISKKVTDIENISFELNEFQVYKYSFPQLIMLKGGSELIKYNFAKKEYHYCKLPSPFLVVQNSRSDELTIKGLIDLGPYLWKASISLYDHKDLMSLEADLNYIVKSLLPEDKLLSLVAETTANFINMKEEAFLLHFANFLVAYSKRKEPKVELK